MTSAILTFLKDVGLSFIPLFVAVDAIGILPFILSLTQDMNPAERPKTIRYAMLTAFALGLVFIGIGKGIIFLTWHCHWRLFGSWWTDSPGVSYQAFDNRQICRASTKRFQRDDWGGTYRNTSSGGTGSSDHIAPSHPTVFSSCCNTFFYAQSGICLACLCPGKQGNSPVAGAGTSGIVPNSQPTLGSYSSDDDSPRSY